MYLPDLSTYPFLESKDNIVFKAVGWLDVNHNFTQGSVTNEFMACLWGFCQTPMIVSMGFHDCDLCNKFNYGYGVYAKREDMQIRLGSTIVAVFDGFSDYTVYVAPDMIYHYILEHQYLPPQQFVDSILKSPPPDSFEYDELTKKLK